MSQQVLTALYTASTWVIPLVIAITFHEASHGYIARLCGDDTAWRLGRVSFNPLKHIDPFGTILLPAMLLLIRSPILFGYAKPVPVNFQALLEADRRVAREAASQLVKLSIFGFIAGFLAVLIFHQTTWYLLNLGGLIPLDRPAWPLDPIPPYGVPSVISKAFWGGAWGALLAPLLQGLTGRAYWAGWIIIGAVTLSLVAFFVVPPMKGEPIPALWPRFLAALLVNAAWGLGTALFLKLARTTRG